VCEIWSTKFYFDGTSHDAAFSAKGGLQFARRPLGTFVEFNIGGGAVPLPG